MTDDDEDAIELTDGWERLAFPPARLASFEQQERFIEAAQTAGPISQENENKFKMAAIAADSLGRHPESLSFWQEQIKLKSDNHEVLFEAGCQNLILESFAAGWSGFLHYYATADYARKKDGLPPIWDGRQSGRGIIVFADQGRGDAIMAIRYVPQLLENFERAIFLCTDDLVTLARSTHFFENVVSLSSISSSTYGSIDGMDCQFHVPALALPAYFNASISSLPPPPDCFGIDQHLIESLRAEFASPGKLRVGLAWKGGPRTPRDPLRSFEAKDLQKVVSVSGVSFYSIQWDAEDLEVALLGPNVEDIWRYSKEVIAEGREWSLLETGAFIAGLDLVITCDSVICHLAASMNVDTWIALPLASEWRWGLGEQSIWYQEKVTLFRQTRYDEWGDVFASIAQQLSAKTHD